MKLTGQGFRSKNSLISWSNRICPSRISVHCCTILPLIPWHLRRFYRANDFCHWFWS
jgi:hypothetical protein